MRTPVFQQQGGRLVAPGRRQRRGGPVAADVAMESVRPQYPQVAGQVCAGIRPAVFPLPARFDGVAARTLRQPQAVVHVQHQRGVARVGHAHPLAAIGRPGFDMARIGRRPAARSWRARLVLRAGEIEGVAQVAADGAPPWADVGLGHAKARLQQADDRGMVIDARIEPAAAAERRDHQHGHARPQAIGAPMQRARVVGGAGRRAAARLVVFARGVRGAAAARRAGRRGRRHVVEKAVVLVVR
ncbi:hypothetical protein L559_2722 [Bordetella pertussis STO1-CHOC-0017]|nr:hypothetical protein L559_2722 [Bordetella pertussis STO1-CHOC-0017]